MNISNEPRAHLALSTRVHVVRTHEVAWIAPNLGSVALTLLAANYDGDTPLRGVALRWIERNGWWAVLALAFTVGGVLWSWREPIGEMWREGWRDWRSTRWREQRYVVVSVVLALAAAILAAVLGS